MDDTSQILMKDKDFQDVIDDESNVNLAEEFFETIKKDVLSNVVSQFGLSQFYDKYQTGGGVDTVHNARHDVYSSEEVEQELKEKTSGYNKQVAQELHGAGSQRYRDINAKQSAQKKAGTLIDPYTGKLIKKNQKTDLDHNISTKEVYEDKGRELSGLSADEAANTEANLHQTDRSINRSMSDKSKADYADMLAANKKKWAADRDKILRNPNLSDEKKEAQLKNIDNRMEADEASIRQADEEARKSYNNQINKKYYGGKDFAKNLGKQAGKQGLLQAKKAAVGVLIVELGEVISSAFVPVVKDWQILNSMKARLACFRENLEAAIESFKIRMKDVIEKIGLSAISGGFSGFMAQIVTTLINTFTTTSTAFAKLLNDGIMGVVQAIKVMTSKDPSVSRKDKILSGATILTTAVVTSVGVLLTEGLRTYIQTVVPIAPFADIISGVIGAIFTGFVSATLVFAITHFGDILKQLTNTIDTMVYGATVTVKQLETDYQLAVQQIDETYTAILQRIGDEYARIHQFQSILLDFSKTTGEQFTASIQYADEVGVPSNQVLRTKSDIDDFFLN